MKKKIIIFIFMIGILLIGSVLAITFDSKEDMLEYFKDYKKNRERDINNMVFSIKYTTDKECEINYESEEINCGICFEYFLNTDEDRKTENCIALDEESTIEQDDNIVKDYVKRVIETETPIEEIKYIKQAMKDRQMQLSLKK